MQKQIKKIAIVVPIFRFSGSEGIAHKTANMLAKKGFEVDVLCSDDKEERTNDYKEKSGIKIKRFHTYLKIGKFARIWFPKNDYYDLIHCFGGYNHPHFFWIYLNKKDSKFFVSPFYPLHPRNFSGKILFSASNFFGKKVLKNADYCFAETNKEKQWLKNYNTKVGLLPFSITQDYFKKYNKNKKFSGEGKTILFLGGHIPIKNIDILIKALPLVKEKITLIIGGKETEYSMKCKELAKELGVENKIKWVGFLGFKEKMEAYNSCDLFILPSKREALGTTVIEAMSQGKPVITSNTGGLIDVVPDEICLVNPNNEKELADKINLFLRDSKLSEKIGKLGKEKVIKYFVFEKNFENYLKILDKLGE